MTCEELLTLPLAKRIQWLHSKDGPKGEMSHDRLAAALGTSRQTVISWEKGVEPKKLVDALVTFSGCPPETWKRHEGEVVSADSIDLRLQSLEETVEKAGRETAKALRALTRAIERLERLPALRDPRATEAAAR